MSIGENWLAPQPTANIANAILSQAPGLLLVTVVLAMASTLRGGPAQVSPPGTLSLSLVSRVAS